MKNTKKIFLLLSSLVTAFSLHGMPSKTVPASPETKKGVCMLATLNKQTPPSPRSNAAQSLLKLGRSAEVQKKSSPRPVQASVSHGRLPLKSIQANVVFDEKAQEYRINCPAGRSCLSQKCSGRMFSSKKSKDHVMRNFGNHHRGLPLSFVYNK